VTTNEVLTLCIVLSHVPPAYTITDFTLSVHPTISIGNSGLS